LVNFSMMILRTMLLLVLVSAARVFAAGPDLGVPIRPGNSIHRLNLHSPGADHINYLLSLPAAYFGTPTVSYPLIVLLHGTEQRGDNPEILRSVAALTLADVDESFPFVAVFPQCPRGEHWSPAALIELVTALEQSLRIDRDRIYLTGFSLGGYGTWQTAAAFPAVFAAIAPLCGMSDLADVPRLQDMPVWAFHGARDRNVPLTESRKMADALRRAGGNVRLTVYPDLAHDCWSVTYRDSRLYLWFLTQKRNTDDDQDLDLPVASLSAAPTGSDRAP
jgi:predicted peptidase